MSRTTDELVRIAAAGGGLTLDISNRETEDVVRIAIAASSFGARIHLVNLRNKSTDELVNIASAGKGCVSFEL